MWVEKPNSKEQGFSFNSADKVEETACLYLQILPLFIMSTFFCLYSVVLVNNIFLYTFIPANI